MEISTLSASNLNKITTLLNAIDKEIRLHDKVHCFISNSLFTLVHTGEIDGVPLMKDKDHLNVPGVCRVILAGGLRHSEYFVFGGADLGSFDG